MVLRCARAGAPLLLIFYKNRERHKLLPEKLPGLCVYLFSVVMKKQVNQ